MDIFTLQKKNHEIANRFQMGASGTASGEDRINDLVKKVTASKPVKNKYGGKDYPIDVSNYGQFVAALETLSWILKDLGYDIQWLTRGGLVYKGDNYYSFPNLFDLKSSKIVAIVAIGTDKHYRISRDSKTLRIRRFDNMTRAIAPMQDGNTTGTKPVNASTARELVNILKGQSNLDPENSDSLRNWGRVIRSRTPVGAGNLKSQLKTEFRKF
jgi:hypothetical protein